MSTEVHKSNFIRSHTRPIASEVGKNSFRFGNVYRNTIDCNTIGCKTAHSVSLFDHSSNPEKVWSELL